MTNKEATEAEEKQERADLANRVKAQDAHAAKEASKPEPPVVVKTESKTETTTKEHPKYPGKHPDHKPPVTIVQPPSKEALQDEKLRAEAEERTAYKLVPPALPVVTPVPVKAATEKK